MRLWLPLIGVSTLLLACSGGEARKLKYLERGQGYLAAGNLDKARVEFRNALQIAPKDAEARFENGVVDEKLGNRREAAQFYQGVIDVSPDDLRARTALARLYLLSRAPNQALETIQPVMAAHPDDVGLLTVRAAAQGQLKQDAPALADAQRAVGLAPTNEDAISVLAGIEVHSGHLDQALGLLEQAIGKMPDSVELRLQLAQLYLAHDQAAKAQPLLVDVIRIQPAQSVHRIRLAQFYASQQRSDEAEKVLRDAIQALPDERGLKIALIELLTSQNQRDQAEQALQGFIARSPKDDELQFALAQFYQQGRDWPRAEAVYRQLIASAGTDAPGLTARDRLATLRSEQNDIAGAQKLLAEVLAKSPRDTDALQLRARLALVQNDPKSAIGDLRSILRDEPNAVPIMRMLARAHLANGEPALAEETLRRAVDANPKDAALRLQLAQILVQVGKPDQARPIVDDILKQQPGNPDALETQFEMALAAKDATAAKAAADALVAGNPKLPAGYYDQGLVAEFGQHYADASRLYSAALELQPAATEPLQGLVRALVRQNRVPEALQRLDDAAARYPQASFPLNLRGEVLLTQKRTDEAIAVFKTAIAREPKNWNSYRNLAIAQSANSDSSVAIATLREGIDTVANREVLEADLASLYARQGKPAEAIKVYEQALARDPQSDAIANNLAMLLVSTRSDGPGLQRARELSARFSNSVNAQFLDTYGWVLYKSGDANGAIAALQNATDKSPQMPELWYHLGMAQKLAGQSVAARSSLTKALQSGRSFTGIEEVRTTLDILARPSAGSSPTS